MRLDNCKENKTDAGLCMGFEGGEGLPVWMQGLIFKLKIFYSKLLKNYCISLRYRLRF